MVDLSSFADPTTCLRLTAAMTAAPAVIGAMEDLSRYAAFADDGLMSWRVARTGGRATLSGPIAALGDRLLPFQRYRAVLWLRVMVGAAVFPALALAVSDGWLALCFSILTLTLFLETLRSPFGHTGANQMVFLLSVSMAVAHATPSATVRAMALGFVAAQAVIAYVTAGVAKAVSPSWRSGQAVVSVMGTNIYGHARLRRLLLRYPFLAKVACWGTIGFECAFLSVLLMRSTITVPLMLVAACFHAAVALGMGLNLFLWAFVATYPSILFFTVG